MTALRSALLPSPAPTRRRRRALGRTLALAVALGAVAAPGASAATGGSVQVAVPKDLGTERDLTFVFTGQSAMPAAGSEPGGRSWNLSSIAYPGTKACPPASSAYLGSSGAVLVGNETLQDGGPFTVRETEVRFSAPGTYRLCTYLATPGGYEEPEQVVTQLLKVPDTSFVPSGPGKKPRAGAWRATKWSWSSGASKRSKATFTVKGARAGNVVGKVISIFCPNGSLGTIETWPAAIVRKYATVRRGRITSVYKHKGGSVTFEGVFVASNRFRGSIHVSTINGCNGGLVFEARPR